MPDVNPVEKTVVRIFDGSQAVVGAGFLVSDQLVLTCAHVVNAALDRSLQEAAPPPPEGTIRLDFPRIAPGQVLTASLETEFWQPPRTDENSEGLDIALLRLSEKAPEGAQAAALVKDTDLWEHPFRAFGFPNGFPDGVWARGVVLGGMASGWVQIVAEKVGPTVAPGFSGGPVWDGLAGGVVGMVVVSDEDKDSRTAGMIPNRVLQKGCPPLAPLLVPPRELAPAGGPFDPQWYVVREKEENLALVHLRSPGFPAVIWGPRSAGKSWLFQQVIHRMNSELPGKKHIVEIDLAHYSPEIRNSPDKILFRIARHIVDELGLSSDLVKEAWDPDFEEDSKDRLERLMVKSVFPQCPGLLVLAIERADAIWGYKAQDELFPMLRSWAEMGQKSPWSRLRLLLAVSTTPTRLSQGKNNSPFNLAPAVDLRDMGDSQIRKIVELYGVDASEEELAKLGTLLGGHPHLVRQALFEAAFSKISLTTVLADQSLERAFGWHLQGYLNWLNDQEGLADAMRSVLNNPQKKLDSRLEMTLERAGLIEWVSGDGRYRVRYKLYEQYLKSRL